MKGDDLNRDLFGKRACALLDVFLREFFDPAAGYYGNGSVNAQLLPLAFGMVDIPEATGLYSHLEKQLREVHGGHVASGLVGMQQFYRTLSGGGLTDAALGTVLRRDHPGIGYMIDHGATTIWELWNGDTANPEMNS